MEAPSAAPKRPQEEVILKYRKLSRNRPPFNFDAEEPLYEQINEQAIFDIEKRIFDAEQNFPLPSKLGLDGFFQKILESQRLLEMSIQAIKGYDQLHENPPGFIPEETTTTPEVITNERSGFFGFLEKVIPCLKRNVTVEIPLSREEQIKNEQKLWERHYLEKKRYFHRALGYLLLCIHYLPDPDEQAKAKRLYLETYTIFVGHQATTFARSASHEIRPDRISGDATITHPYGVCIHGMNRWLKKIEKARKEGDTDLEEKLFKKMMLNMIISLKHDSLEDTFVTKDDLRQKTTEMLNWDYRVITPMREFDAFYDRLPKNLNFADIHNTEIMIGIQALTEPDDNDGGDEYLEKQIDALPEEMRVFILIEKLHDRLHNIRTLKYMSLGKQAKKIHDTIALVDYAIKLWKRSLQWREERPESFDKDLPQELLNLALGCLDQIQRLHNTPKFKDELKKARINLLLVETTEQITDRLPVIHECLAEAA